MAVSKVLVVDDEELVLEALTDFLESRGFQVSHAPNCRSAKDAFRNVRPHIAIVDFRLPDGNAIDLVRDFKSVDENVPIIVLTAHGSIELAVSAIKEGAEHFLTKPVELNALHSVITKSIENTRYRRKQLARGAGRTSKDRDPFLGNSKAIRQLKKELMPVMDVDTPILIQGETGSGKGVLANWIHTNGPRSSEPFVDLNCAGLSRELLESELFGYERGAFTGATTTKQGLLEVAHGGTVFLDEIGDADPVVQSKLLKVVEEKSFRRLGDTKDRKVDVRLIAATHHDLLKLVSKGKFREDLYYRINAITLHIIPLRERREDIPEIIRWLLENLTTELGVHSLAISEDAMVKLQRQDWPGNIRELRNVLERAVLASRESGQIEADHLVFPVGRQAASNEDYSSSLTLAELEKKHVLRVLSEEKGKVESAASRLGIPRSTLYQKLKVYGNNGGESDG